MRRRFILFAFICLAFCACENEQVIALLRAPSQLNWLNITAYAGDSQLEGGASLEPGFQPSVREYTVYVAKDADHFVVDAGTNGGTVAAMSEKDQITGTDFYLDDEPVVLILTVEREYMEIGEYRLTVLKTDTVPTATDIKIHVTPEIGVFFIGRGALPVISVTANLPAAGGELSYQWYINTENNTRTGYPISGATKDSYTMLVTETLAVRTVYYYAEIINTIDGKQGVTKSAPRSVIFKNKYELNPKSLAMVNVPAGNVDTSLGYRWYGGNDGEDDDLPQQWSTPGFLMGQNLVTWELWDTVRRYADAGGYRFAQSGNQGGTNGYAAGGIPSTFEKQLPIGNGLHPVTLISWRTAVIWCNAFSEMDNLQPVYVDSNGNVLRDSRDAVELIVDKTKMAGKNGYRLPTPEEWLYAARGADPKPSPPWTDRWSGTDNQANTDQYLASQSVKIQFPNYELRTIEVGSLKPNSIGLYDMLGMLRQWIWWEDPDTFTGFRGDNAANAGSQFSSDPYNRGFEANGIIMIWPAFISPSITFGQWFGLRIVRNKE